MRFDIKQFREKLTENLAKTTPIRLLAPRLGQRGSFLAAAIIMILFLTAIGLALSSLITTQYSTTKYNYYADNAIQVAEAGIEETVLALNTNPSSDHPNYGDNFPGYSSPETFFNNSDQGEGVFTTTVTNSSNPDDHSKSIVSVGNVYRHAGDSSPYVTRKVKVTVVGTSSTGYSVLTGPGGLIVDGNANITNSDVYVGGKLTLNGNAQIGTYNHPLNIDVNNQACSTGSGTSVTFPVLCTDSTPINFSSNSRIYGTVCARGMSSDPGNNINPGDPSAGDVGLKPSCTPTSVTAPTYDRQGQINDVAVTAGSTANPYSCSAWPANLQLNGSVTLGGNCNTTIRGDVYITGNFQIGANASIRVDDSVTTEPVIIVDGTISVAGNATMIANSSGIGIKFISFKNYTGDPSATSLTGYQLQQSIGQQNVTLQGSSDLPGMVFQAYWSKVYLGGNGQMGAVTGQVVELAGNGTVVFGKKLSSGTTTWTIRSYQRVYN